jgi:tetratricopeptide (TPR) repeat protein
VSAALRARALRPCTRRPRLRLLLPLALAAGVACGHDEPPRGPPGFDTVDAPAHAAIQRAARAWEAGQFHEVEGLLREVLARPEAPPDALWIAGSADFALGRYPRAARRLQEALERKPAYLTIASALGYSRYRIGDFSGARQTYEAIVEVSPGDVKSLYGLGLVELDEGRVGNARRHAERALSIAPADGNARLLLASVLQAEGRTEEAAAQLRALAQDLPGNDEVLYRLGQALATLGRADEAEQVLARRAEVYSARQSVSDLIAGLNVGRDGAAVRARIVSLQLRLGNREAARKALEAGLARFPDDSALRELQSQFALAAR